MFLKANGSFGKGRGSGGSKGGGAKAYAQVSVPTAKTIPEANALAVSLGLAQRADFKGLDISHVNTLIQALDDTRKIIPSLNQISFLGSDIQYRGALGKETFATVYSNLDEIRGLVLSSKFFSTQNLSSILGDLRLSEALHLSPKGTATPKGTMDHEIGHVLDHTYAALTGRLLRDDKVIKSLFRQYGGRKKWIMERNLSSYAATHTREFIAEAWSEYRNNPEPRPCAKAVGDRMIELFKGVKKD